MKKNTLLLVLSALSFISTCALAAASTADGPFSPAAIAASKDGRTLYIAGATGGAVMRFDTAGRQVTATWAVPGTPSGLALSPDEAKLFVTSAAPESTVSVIQVSDGQVSTSVPAGHMALGPVVSPDGKTLFVCNRFNHDVSFIEVASGKELRRVKVQRDPVAAAITRDGKFLLVANLKHVGRADAAHVGAVVSVIDVKEGRVTKELRLPNGSGSLMDIAVSPDGKYAVVTHILSRFPLPATQLDRGWMNTNALTIIDLANMEVLNTVLLDSVDQGAANPWGVAWSADSATVVVAHAGTHELSVINFPGVLARLAKLPLTADQAAPADPAMASRYRAEVPNDLAFLVGLRQRVKLPVTDRGPRAVAVAGNHAYAANYFSDTMTVLDLAAPKTGLSSVRLAPAREMNVVRKGEFYFNDATICFQGWQSCASCHPGDAREDALNWDLLNDGIGNPKNNKSLLLSHRTPPAMSLGVRETAEMAVRAGIRHILFTVQPPEVGDALDEYLKALTPLPSPHLVKGQLSEAAQRGQKIFNTARCADCHPPGLFTDMTHYNVGTAGLGDEPNSEFDTPTLIEVWRTAPYLHDGSAATVQDVLTGRNARDQHGVTSKLSTQEIDDLCAYVLSL
jgi:YVTN family beta-propeller protein